MCCRLSNFTIRNGIIDSSLSSRHSLSCLSLSRLSSLVPLSLSLSLSLYPLFSLSHSFSPSLPHSSSPPRFFTRNGGFLSFTLDTSLPVNTLQYSLPQERRLVAYIFHPFEPFVISIQKTSTTDYVVCFHIRNTIS